MSIHNKGRYYEGVLAFIPAGKSKDVLISSRIYNPLFLVVLFSALDSILKAASGGFVRMLDILQRCLLTGAEDNGKRLIIFYCSIWDCLKEQETEHRKAVQNASTYT